MSRRAPGHSHGARREGRNAPARSRPVDLMREEARRNGWRIVRPVPDLEPAVFDKPRCLYADWITPDLMEELEEEG